jgi:hypothetical protein
MMEQLDLTSRLRAIVGTGGRRRVYPVHLALLAFMVGSLAGMERLAHFDAFQGDCLVIRALRFSQWPVRKVVSVALASLSEAQRDQVVDLVTEVGLSTLPPSTKSVIIDFDPTVIVSYGDADEIVSFMEDVLERVRAYFGEDCAITFRDDAGLWNAKVKFWHLENPVAFAMAMPLKPGVKLYAQVVQFSEVNEDPDIQAALVNGEQVGAGAGVRVAIVRRRVHDPKAPPQGKVIPGVTGWRYQAVVSDRDWPADDLWRFYDGRADCERSASATSLATPTVRTRRPSCCGARAITSTSSSKPTAKSEPASEGPRSSRSAWSGVSRGSTVLPGASSVSPAAGSCTFRRRGCSRSFGPSTNMTSVLEEPALRPMSRPPEPEDGSPARQLEATSRPSRTGLACFGLHKHSSNVESFPPPAGWPGQRGAPGLVGHILG